MANLLIVLLAVFLGGLLTLGGVALGGFLVFKTKRGEEPLFQGKQDGFAVNLDDEFSEGSAMNLGDDEDKPPEAVESANESFIKQFAGGLKSVPTD